MGKKVAAHIGQVIKGILFIGFSIQIVLGIIWMCSNFMHIQDFGEPESVFYGAIFRALGSCPQVMYVLQLAAAFVVAYVFLQVLFPTVKWFAIWRALVLVSFPFAMQMALAIQPYSFMGSIFLLMLCFILKRRGRFVFRLPVVLACAVLFVVLSGAVDADREEKVWGRGWEASLASRMGWASILNDRTHWSEELIQYTEEIWWKTTYCADNMTLMLDTLEEQVGEEKTKEYCLEIAEVGWYNRKSVIIRHMMWDVAGYAVTPLIFPMQLAGEAYDSYSAGNYAVMREHTPLLTGRYVEYGCWWFCCYLGLTVILAVLSVVVYVGTWDKRCVRRVLSGVGICAVISGVLVVGLTMRGAGIMDYRWTIAVNQLWLICSLLLMRRDGNVI